MVLWDTMVYTKTTAQVLLHQSQRPYPVLPGLVTKNFYSHRQKWQQFLCVQNIQISNPDPFDYYDITFPANKESNGCSVSNANPSQTGHPCSTTPNVPMWRLPMKPGFHFYGRSLCENHQNVDRY